MSLTLRDAQHLCWKTFKKLEKLTQKPSDKSATASDLTKKAAEISERVQQAGPPDSEASGKLLSELLFYAFVLAEHQGVDLEENFLQTVDELILGMVT